MLRLLKRRIRAFKDHFGSPDFPARETDAVGQIGKLFSFPKNEWANRLKQDLANDDSIATWQQVINPLYWASWFSGFLSRWGTSRPIHALVPALPALIAGCISIAAVTLTIRRQLSATQEHYRETVYEALTEQKPRLAAVAVKRLLLIDPDNHDDQFQQALIEAEYGDPELARKAMHRLAVDKNHAVASLWVLRHTLLEPVSFERDGVAPEWLISNAATEDANSKGSEPPPQGILRKSWSDSERALCAHCYQLVVSQLPPRQSVPAKKMYAGFLALNDMPSDALRLYEEVAQTDHSVCLRASLLCEQLGHPERAKTLAMNAIQFLKPKVVGNEESIDWRLKLVEATALTGQYRESLQLIDDGMVVSQDPRLPALAGEMLVSLYKQIESNNSFRRDGTLFGRATLLTKVFVLAPATPGATDLLYRLSLECESLGQDRLRQLRIQQIESQPNTPVHFVEGLVYSLGNAEPQRVEQQFELAAKASGAESVSRLLADFALTLSRCDNQRLLPALRLANESLRFGPDDPVALFTRGKIQHALGSRQDAISDFERAISLIDNPQDRREKEMRVEDRFDDSFGAKCRNALRAAMAGESPGETASK